LDHLQQSLVSDVDVLTRYSVTGPDLGGCPFCYPQPVDLDRVVSGYGARIARAPGRYGFGLPPGVPDWVPSSLGSCPCARESVTSIAEMSRQGVADPQILALLRKSRLGNPGDRHDPGLERARPPAGMSGSDLARLRSMGVSDTVLDALQARFLGQLVETKRLEYQSWF
jgi:hypothetical protein